MHSNVNGVFKSCEINVSKGIFQVDTSSPLLFCTSLIALTSEISRTVYGYKLSQKKMSHLFYMDELMFYAEDDNEMGGLLKTIKCIGDNIGI